MAISLKVNGASRSTPAEPDTPLLYVLRNDLFLAGAKFGCGLAQCGACTVLVDGKAMRSCVTPIGTLGNAEITTIEGLGTIEKPHPLQKAFIDEQAAQCGYCINGMIMKAKELLDQQAAADRGRRARGAGRSSLPLRHPQPHCRRGRAGRQRDGEDLTMNAPTLTRRGFTKGLGGLVLAFSLDPAELLAPGRRRPAARQPQQQPMLRRLDPDRRRRQRHRLHRQGRARAGHPDRALADRRRGARSGAVAGADLFGRHRAVARTRGRPPAASRSRTAARRCAWPAPRCARCWSISPRQKLARAGEYADRRRRRHQHRRPPQGHLCGGGRAARSQPRGDRQGRSRSPRRRTRSSASRCRALDIPGKVTGRHRLRAGHLRSRHGARPRGAAAALRLDAGERRRRRGQQDARRHQGGARRLVPRRRRRARGAGDQGARGAGQGGEVEARAGTAGSGQHPCPSEIAAEQDGGHRRQAGAGAGGGQCPHARGDLHQALSGARLDRPVLRDGDIPQWTA